MLDYPQFLGTMGGNQEYLTGVGGEQTYGRKYLPFVTGDELRLKISKMGSEKNGKGYKNIGNLYSFTPSHLQDKNRKFYSKSPCSMQGGGYFLTIKKYNKEASDRLLNCFAYAIGTFGGELEKLAKKEMKEIQKSVAYTIDPVVEAYFINVKEPEEGDLVVYSVLPGGSVLTPNKREVTGTTHAGIYRKTVSNWNSPDGGSVESKWGWFANPYVFQHDVFFTPNFYGDQVKFYRLKKQL